MEMIVVESFADSADKFAGDMKDRIFFLVLRVTGDPELPDSLATDNPASFVIGKFVEDSYIQSMNRAYTIDTLMKGE